MTDKMPIYRFYSRMEAIDSRLSFGLYKLYDRTVGWRLPLTLLEYSGFAGFWFIPSLLAFLFFPLVEGVFELLLRGVCMREGVCVCVCPSDIAFFPLVGGVWVSGRALGLRPYGIMDTCTNTPTTQHNTTQHNNDTHHIRTIGFLPPRFDRFPGRGKDTSRERDREAARDTGKLHSSAVHGRRVGGLPQALPRVREAPLGGRDLKQ